MKAKKRSILLFVIALMLCITAVYAVKQDQINQIDKKTGKRTGLWMQFLGTDMKVVSDTLYAVYYREIMYDKGEITAPVKYFYRVRKLFFEATMKSVDPDVFADGKIYAYYANGNLKYEQS